MNWQPQKYREDLSRYYRMPAVQVSVTLALSLFVMGVFIAFAIRPTILSIVKLKKTIEQSKKTLSQLELKIDNLEKASIELEKVKSSLAAVNTSIPNNEEGYISINGAIENLAANSLVELDNSSLGPSVLFSRLYTPFEPKKTQGIIELPFTARVVGNYTNIVQFLSGVLSMKRIVEVESITITREAGSKTAAINVSMNINGNAFYLADQEIIKKILNSSVEKK